MDELLKVKKKDHMHQEVVHQTVKKGKKKEKEGIPVWCLIKGLQYFDSVDHSINIYIDVQSNYRYQYMCVSWLFNISLFQCSITHCISYIIGSQSSWWRVHRTAIVIVLSSEIFFHSKCKERELTQWTSL